MDLFGHQFETKAHMHTLDGKDNVTVDLNSHSAIQKLFLLNPRQFYQNLSYVEQNKTNPPYYLVSELPFADMVKLDTSAF